MILGTEFVTFGQGLTGVGEDSRTGCRLLCEALRKVTVLVISLKPHTRALVHV